MIRTSIIAAALIAVVAASPAAAGVRLQGTAENGMRMNGATALSSAIQATGIRLPSGIILRAE